MPHTFEDGEPDMEHTIVRKTADAQYRIARDDVLFKPMFAAATKDMEYQEIINAIKMDIKFEDLHKDHPGKMFQKVWDNLAILDEKENTLLIYDSNKVVVPKAMRHSILKLPIGTL